MAREPCKGGGFIINDLGCTQDDKLTDLLSAYPGENPFSPASDAAIFIRDPYPQVELGRGIGCAFTNLIKTDWRRMEPYFVEKYLFGFKVVHLLTVN